MTQAGSEEIVVIGLIVNRWVPADRVKGTFRNLPQPSVAGVLRWKRRVSFWRWICIIWQISSWVKAAVQGSGLGMFVLACAAVWAERVVAWMMPSWVISLE